MVNENKLHLFRKTDTTLVYITTNEFAKQICGENYNSKSKLYIHIGLNNGSVNVYEDNNINKIVTLDIKKTEYILKLVEDER